VQNGTKFVDKKVLTIKFINIIFTICL